MILFGVLVFLGAFLLFQVQPLIAKMILPWFGGSSAVWSACMLFFQAALLAGYLYAHGLQRRLSPKWQAVVHTALLAASLTVLPIIPDPAWKSAALANPTWRILGLLAVTVGLPYFLLSTTSPLVQTWYARTRPGSSPYRLFALSNLASMLGLLTYPAVIEPNLSTAAQARLWSVAYVCFAALCAARAWLSVRAAAPAKGAEEAELAAPPAPGWGARLLWMALPACASILLLSITNYLTQDVAAVPFLWVAPLAVYLLTFILCFEAPRLYDRRVYLGLLVPALILMGYMLSVTRDSFKLAATIMLTVGSLFILAMVCHGEAARRRPHPRYLTTFYVMLSLGGAIGGVFVGLIAPMLFNGYFELPIGLWLCAALAVTVVFWDRRGYFSEGLGRQLATAMAVCVLAYGGWLAYVTYDAVQGYRLVSRNFYGQLRVYDHDEDDEMGPRRKLLHGVINHGEQFLSDANHMRPGTYFCPGTGVGRVLGAPGAGPRRVGVLGLGCGTLAAYGRAGDEYRIYEINPTVIEVARKEFTYLRDSKARVEIVPGDGRLSLESEPGQNFDVLVMDAFSGDSVPVHLVTVEAFRTYVRHLKPTGILALNISNKYLELRPVMERAAHAVGRVAVAYHFAPEVDDVVCFGASWVLIVRPEMKGELPADAEAQVLPPERDFRTWTDDYSSLRNILKR
jgi:hypothetical protein